MILKTRFMPRRLWPHARFEVSVGATVGVATMAHVQAPATEVAGADVDDPTAVAANLDSSDHSCLVFGRDYHTTFGG